MSDHEIIKLLKNNPSEGLHEAIGKYSRLVRTIVRRILPYHAQDVEECVEDTFVSVWRHIGNVEAGAPFFKGYILRTARNIAISRYRQIRRNDTVPLDSVPEPIGGGVEECILEKDASRELEKLILQMQEPDRGIFFRRYFLFESYKQVAQAMGLSEVQVKNKLYRVKLRLRNQLEERGVSYEVNG